MSGTRDLREPAIAEPDREHAQVHALHAGVAEVAAVPARGERLGALVDGQTARPTSLADRIVPCGETYCTLPAASPNGLGGRIVAVAVAAVGPALAVAGPRLQ